PQRHHRGARRQGDPARRSLRQSYRAVSAGLRPASRPSVREDRIEASDDEAPRVEGRLAGAVQPAAFVQPGFTGFEAFPVRPDLPGEDDLLAGLRLNRPPEIGHLAVRNVVFPGFDDLDATVVLEDFRTHLGPPEIGSPLFLRHGGYEAGDIHGQLPSDCAAPEYVGSTS